MNARLKPTDTALAPQLEKNRRRMRTVLIMIGLVIVVFIGAMFEIKPALREVSRWRSRRYAAKAEVDLSAEDWQNAQLKAQIAYQLRPDEPAAIRVVARLQSLTGNSAMAVKFWDLLQDAKEMTVADRRMRAEDLLRTGAMPQARKEVETLLAENPGDAATLRLGAKWAAADKNYDQALKFASQAQQIDPGNLQGKVLLGLLQCEAPRTGSLQTGTKILLELVEDRGRQGLESLSFLATRRDLPAETALKIVTRLREHPLAAESHRLLSLDLELATSPDQREAILDAAMERYKKVEPNAQRALAVWLNTHKEYERTLNLIPVEEAMKRKDYLLVTLDAMAAQKRWTEIDEVLQGKNVPLDEVYIELFLARAAMELGRATNADLHWRRAHMAAAPKQEAGRGDLDFKQMWFLASYAEKIGQTDQAEIAYRSLTSNSVTARPAYEGLLRLAEKRRDTEAVRDLLEEMTKRWPKDNSVRNDYTYFSLLRGKDLDDALKVARQMVKDAPTSLAHRTTLALANLRLNDPAAALAVYNNLNIPWDKTPASHRAIYAAVLGRNGKTDEARTLAAAVPIDVLRPEERELITQWRAP